MKLQFSWIQAFSTEEILKHHTKDCFKINSNQKNIMPKKGDYVKFKNYERKINSPFIIYADFESILVQTKRVLKSLVQTNIKNIFLAVIVVN